MAQTGAGIQELMAAETRASQIVAEARMGRLSLFWMSLRDSLGTSFCCCFDVYHAPVQGRSSDFVTFLFQAVVTA